MNEDKPVIVAH